MDTTLCVLIVDDDEDDIYFLKEAIEDVIEHAVCLTANNGEEALNFLKSRKDGLPDFIFMDLNMPRMDGATCLTKLKGHNDWREIPVVIYTTSSSTAHKERMKKLGAACFITKPTSYHFLRKAIAEAFDIVMTIKDGKNS